MDFVYNTRELKITIDAKERAELQELHDENPGYLSDRLQEIEFLMPLICNSELQWIYPEDTGDLTSAPMLGIWGEQGIKGKTEFPPHYGFIYCGSDGENVFVAPIILRWAWMDYQVKALLQELLEKGEAILISGEDKKDGEKDVRA